MQQYPLSPIDNKLLLIKKNLLIRGLNNPVNT